MPQWIHDRADHILSKNPSMPKGEAFALATQQAHAVDKSPKGYGTSEGRATAKAKYPTPGDDKKTAAVYAAFNDELQKIAVSEEYIARRTRMAAHSAAPERIREFKDNIGEIQSTSYLGRPHPAHETGEQRSERERREATRGAATRAADIALFQKKHANILEAAKRLALTDVGGPPGLLQPMGAAVANTAKKRLGSFAPQATQRLVSGAHDVSGLAARMGI